MYGGLGDLTSPCFGLAAMHKMHAVLKPLLICAFWHNNTHLLSRLAHMIGPMRQ